MPDAQGRSNPGRYGTADYAGTTGERERNDRPGGIHAGQILPSLVERGIKYIIGQLVRPGKVNLPEERFDRDNKRDIYYFRFRHPMGSPFDLGRDSQFVPTTADPDVLKIPQKAARVLFRYGQPGR